MFVPTDLTLSELNTAAQTYLNLGLSTSTRKAYKTGVHKYITFYTETQHRPVPVCEDKLLLFATYLAQQHLSYPTIQVYLSAVRHSQIITGRSLPSVTPRLSYVLKSIRRSSALTYTPRERLPITFPIMTCLHAVLLKNTDNYRDVMIWAACCLAYFGLLRVSEFTTSSPNHFDPSKDLLLSDIALNNQESPSLIQITLKETNSGRVKNIRGKNYS